MRPRSRKVHKCGTLIKRSAVCICILSVVYCEFLVYIKQSLHWPMFECKKSDPSCTKILFIADPQIQGDNAVPFPLNYIFNWDSDRYLKSTFTIAVNIFEPDVMVFLGDLMDEGSISTERQFQKYSKRLTDIFTIDDYPVMKVWVTGDNDIGGENESIKRDKIMDFEKFFNQSSIITYRNLYFFKVNGITREMPEYNLENHYDKGDDVRIVVSHYPLTRNPTIRNKVKSTYAPHIYFCAHDHKSKYAMMDQDFSNRRVVDFDGSEALGIQIRDPTEALYEVYVPTCSYRMGTSEIGYGVAIIEDNGSVIKYTVFWSPERFPYLLFYLFLVIIIIITYFIGKLRSLMKLCQQICYKRAQEAKERYNEMQRNDTRYLLNRI